MPDPALLRDVARDGCAAHCGDLIEAGASGCLDKFYAALSNPTVVPDPIPCGIGIVPANKSNFKALCEDKAQLPPDLADCDNAPTGTLDFWEDECGGIHIPFDWTEIRKEDGNPITRWVACRSATARVWPGNPDNEKPIWIPGREFLGSTPWDDASASYPSTNWRKPEIEPWYPDDSPHEAGLRGTVDQNDSIVHVYPRMPVYRVCKVGTNYEGCMKVGEKGAIQCACSDRYDPASCGCETLHSPMYFQCDVGKFAGMPCTRHDHCKPKYGTSGNCSRRPSCQPKSPNRVWGGRGTERPRNCPREPVHVGMMAIARGTKPAATHSSISRTPARRSSCTWRFPPGATEGTVVCVRDRRATQTATATGLARRARASAAASRFKPRKRRRLDRAASRSAATPTPPM
jgi:hypothetical protein